MEARAPLPIYLRITCETENATILYRVGNYDELFYSQEEMKSFIDESSSQYSEPVKVGDTQNLYAYARKDGMQDSDVAYYRYNERLIT